MNNCFRILVFPCGSEVALEIHQSLKYSRHIEMIGGTSVDDHGKYVFKECIENIPFATEDNFIDTLKNIVKEHNIDAIYPAMDSVIYTVKNAEAELGCKVISSPLQTTELCLSKNRTYERLQYVIKTPEVYNHSAEVNNYPVFIKPDQGYGSRGAQKVQNGGELELLLSESLSKMIISEYLPGDEYTIDCFTNFKGELLFSGARKRNRISNGISVNTFEISDPKFKVLAIAINDEIEFRGAWFFQVKKDVNDEYKLLEVASRLGGSSSLFRLKGINFALLSIFDQFDLTVGIQENTYEISLDRALDSKYKINIEFDTVYIDFDDCLLLGDQINPELITFIFQCLNNKKRLILITKHGFDIQGSLEKYRLNGLFDEVIHLQKSDQKYKFMKHGNSIFIDDSFVERQQVLSTVGIPVFAPDMIKGLLE
jgi:hypothetical protein